MQNALSETQKQAQMSLESRKFRRKWERPAYRTPRSPASLGGAFNHLFVYNCTTRYSPSFNTDVMLHAADEEKGEIL